MVQLKKPKFIVSIFSLKYLLDPNSVKYLFDIYMLTCRTIRQLFSQMILFNGKMGYNPNTLNNRVHTYFLAHKWAEMNKHEGKAGKDVPTQ